MRYGLETVHDHGDGRTTIFLKDKVMMKLAIITWNKSARAKLRLHSSNASGLPSSAAAEYEVSTSDDMPVLTADELATVLATIKTQATECAKLTPMKFI